MKQKDFEFWKNIQILTLILLIIFVICTFIIFWQFIFLGIICLIINALAYSMRVKLIGIRPYKDNIKDIINTDSIGANINDISKQTEDFIDKIISLINTSKLAIYANLQSYFESIAGKKSLINPLSAAVVNELHMEESTGPAKNVLKKESELIEKGKDFVLSMDELRLKLALNLRIIGILLMQGVIASHYKTAEGIKFLIKAKEIDPHGRVPTGKELDRMFKKLDINY